MRVFLRPRGIFALFFALFLGAVSTSCLPGGAPTSGTLYGNADGYGGRQVVRVAYNVDPRETCEGQAVDYRYRLDYLDDGSVMRYDVCTKEAVPVETSAIDSLENVVAAYSSLLYEYRTSPPDPQAGDPFYVAWCKALRQPENRSLGFVIQTTIHRNLQGSVYEGNAGTITLPSPSPVEATHQGAWRTVIGANFEAAVRYVSVGNEGNERYLGVMRYLGEEHAIECYLATRSLP